MSTYTSIGTQTLGSAASEVNFFNIPQGFTDLVIVINAGCSSNGNVMYMQFNGDTTSNYSNTMLFGSGSSFSSQRTINDSFISLSQGAGLGTGITWNCISNVMNYSNSTTFKTVLTRDNIASGGLYLGTEARVSLKRSTSPVTSIRFYTSAGNIVAGSTFSLYGIAGGSAGPKASGGIVTTSGGYAYHTFYQSGGFIPSENLTVDYLVVAGGGGGSAGGGGAGGLRSTVTATGGGGTVESALSLTAGVTYPAVVGAGGYGSYSYSASGSERQGGNGNNSAFHIITSVGGGGGGSITYSSNPNPAMSGGSGGGATYSSGGGNYGLGTPNQGYAGGQHTNPNPPYPGSGGGGAGQLGNPPAGSNGGAGGNGVQITALATPTSTGADSGYYAGGGGGGVYGAGSTAAGGLGGGGSASGGGSVGTANTGGGGAGVSNAAIGKAGGSGIIIIRYAI